MSQDIRLRRVPYPYRAMLAIANDVDEAGWDDFLLLHEFMNTERPTPLGRGLALEIGDSFFMYRTTGDSKTPTFAYFDGVTPGRRAPWADAMDALIDAGYLDCLHSWGEFSRTGGFRRELALQAADVLNRTGKVRVWINHGDARNEQMVGRPGWDDPASPHGHADITLGCGLRYFWTGALTSTIGQDADDRWLDRLHPGRVVDDVVRPLRKVAARGTGLVRFFGNHLMKSAFAAGREIRVFQRYGFWNKPTACDLSDVLSPSVLDTLERRGGFMALYTHLFRRPSGMTMGQVDWSPLVELAVRHRAGRIKVTTTARLLEYADTAATVRWSVDVHDGRRTIRIPGRPASGSLAGLTFYVPDAERTSLMLDGHPVDVVHNPPDDTGSPSISVPWKSLVYPLTALTHAGAAAR